LELDETFKSTVRAVLNPDVPVLLLAVVVSDEVLIDVLVFIICPAGNFTLLPIVPSSKDTKLLDRLLPM
jgi:hypothetical protein